MLHDANAAFPMLQADRAAVRVVHHGLTPAVTRGGRADLQLEPTILRHERDGMPGLLSLIGVKVTTARRAAERAVDAVAGELGAARARCRTAARALPHAGIADVEGRLVETLRSLGAAEDRVLMDHLTGWYGTEASAVAELSVQRNLLDRLACDSPVIAGEIAYAAEASCAVRLADAVLRRTALGGAGHPGRSALERAADVMGALRQWTPERRQEEIALVEHRYPKPGI
jgi:glycerol-3-phosphate dehydrogenase